MKFEQNFKYSQEKVFTVLIESVKQEIKHFTNEEPNDLKNYEYSQNRGSYNTKCIINTCDLENGYSATFFESSITNYEIQIKFEFINEDECNLIYINTYNSTSTSKKWNYALMSFLYKGKIQKKIKKLTAYLLINLEKSN